MLRKNIFAKLEVDLRGTFTCDLLVMQTLKHLLPLGDVRPEVGSNLVLVTMYFGATLGYWCILLLNG